jgi:hypothetical protein
VMRGIISIKGPFISPGYPVSLVISSQIGLKRRKRYKIIILGQTGRREIFTVEFLAQRIVMCIFIFGRTDDAGWMMLALVLIDIN